MTFTTGEMPVPKYFGIPISGGSPDRFREANQVARWFSVRDKP
ncbi:MAG: hypothetical protein WD426_20815 [Anditalea sp.]